MTQRSIRTAAATALLTLTTAALAACEPPPEPWWPTVRTTGVAMTPGYKPVVGDLDGDGYDDILWYDTGADVDPGTTADHPEQMWLGRSDGHFVPVAAPDQVHGQYRPIVMQLDGSGPDDIVWYDATGPSPVWVMGPGAVIAERGTRQLARRSTPFLIDATGQPDALGFRLPGRDDPIVVWSASQDPDDPWLSVIDDSNGAEPVAGDFDGDGLGDVFLHRPGPGPDAVAWHASLVEPTANVQGSYMPVAADTDGDGRDDIVFVNATASGRTPVWTSGPSRTFTSRSHEPVGDANRPPVQRATVPGGRDALPLRHLAPQEGPFVWRIRPDGSSGTEWTGAEPIRQGAQEHVLGHFSDGIREGVLIYDGFGSGTGNRLMLSPRATA